jgi:hypothetical protein
VARRPLILNDVQAKRAIIIHLRVEHPTKYLAFLRYTGPRTYSIQVHEHKTNS